MTTVLLFSIVVALLSMTLQVYSDYKLERTALESKLRNVVESLEPALTNSLWMIDETSTEVILEGILRLPEVYNVTLISEQGDTRVLGEPPSGQPTLSLTQTLSAGGEQPREIGELTVLASLEPVYTGLLEETALVLLSQVLKMLVIVAFFLWVFWWLVSRHLEHLSNYSQQVGQFDHPGAIALNRKLDEEDELSRVADAFNLLAERIRKQNRELQFVREESERLIEDAQAEIFLQQEGCRHLLENLRACLAGLPAEPDQQQTSLTNSILQDLGLAMALIRRRRGSRSAPFDLEQELHKALDEFSQVTNLKCSTQVVVDDGFPIQVAGDSRMLRSGLLTLVTALALLDEPGSITLQGQLVHRAARGFLRVRVNAEDDGKPLGAVAQSLLSSLRLTVPAENLRELSGYVKLFLFQLQMSLQQGDFGFVADKERGNSVWLEITLQTAGHHVKKAEDRSAAMLDVLGIGLSAEIASKFERVYEGLTAQLTCLRACQELEDYVPYIEPLGENPELVILDSRNLGSGLFDDDHCFAKLKALGDMVIAVIVGSSHHPDLERMKKIGIDIVLLPDDLDEVLPHWFQGLDHIDVSPQGIWLSPMARKAYGLPAEG